MSSYREILEAAIHGEAPDTATALMLWEEAPHGLLVAAANDVRQRMHPGSMVGWIIDRNVNLTNVCLSMCSFCNFCRSKNHEEAYVLSLDEYEVKIAGLRELGGDQILLQGGLHPDFGLQYYAELFRALKARYPFLKLHALGPPEIVHLSRMEGVGTKEVIEVLISAGLDSLPGAGAEILSDRVRQQLSPKKCSTAEWLDVMREAHQLGMVTSATMMFGHIETIEERLQHLNFLREVQAEKPEGAPGFLSFIPWPFQEENTVLARKFDVHNTVGAMEYIKLIAISRLMLPNIPNIQASWLTVGKDVAQFCLHAGANDFGSIMIEEKVVAGAGAHHRLGVKEIQEAIREAGFIPYRRNQRFEIFSEGRK